MSSSKKPSLAVRGAIARHCASPITRAPPSVRPPPPGPRAPPRPSLTHRPPPPAAPSLPPSLPIPHRALSAGAQQGGRPRRRLEGDRHQAPALADVWHHGRGRGAPLLLQVGPLPGRAPLLRQGRHALVGGYAPRISAARCAARGGSLACSLARSLARSPVACLRRRAASSSARRAARTATSTSRTSPRPAARTREKSARARAGARGEGGRCRGAIQN